MPPQCSKSRNAVVERRARLYGLGNRRKKDVAHVMSNSHPMAYCMVPPQHGGRVTKPGEVLRPSPGADGVLGASGAYGPAPIWGWDTVQTEPPHSVWPNEEGAHLRGRSNR